MFELQTNLNLNQKLNILADAAKYDVACTSSGVDRKGEKGKLGNSKACGICHSFASDGRCISLLKILMTNHCVYDCKYCINRVSNDVPRATFTPEEICELTMEFYKRNYIEGLFLSSGVIKNPAYTMEKMCETLALLRNKCGFNGYIHVKTIPGAPDELLAAAGYLADRISVNMELPTEESLKKLAPNKSYNAIINPMAKVSTAIAKNRILLGKDARMERASGTAYLKNSIFNKSATGIDRQSQQAIEKYTQNGQEQTESNNSTGNMRDSMSNGSIRGDGGAASHSHILDLSDARETGYFSGGWKKRHFAPAGQSTQIIIGASGESDYTLLQTTQKLYQTFDLKRVFYSAYIPINEDSSLPAIGTPPPLLREHRLYQADWLLRFYGFRADELLTEEKPDFNINIDPKCDWALRHLEMFPIEIQTASYADILRVPGIGPRSAKRIMQARRYGAVSFDNLKKMGVVLKRAHYFITCGGRMMYNTPIEEKYIERQLTAVHSKENWQTSHTESYTQMSLFDDFGVG